MTHKAARCLPPGENSGLGLAAGHLILQRRFGTMVALSGTRIVETTLGEGVAASRTLDLTYYNEAAAFFQ